MSKMSRIIPFLIVNTLGFLSVPITYHMTFATGIIAADNPGFDPEAFKTYFLQGTFLTWIVCALFSIAYFFVKGKERLIFLWAPVVIPMAYGLKSLFGLFA
ncbi:MAG: hypothetical protein WBK77_00135 [Alphaproteobacteria bacterium]